MDVILQCGCQSYAHRLSLYVNNKDLKAFPAGKGYGEEAEELEPRTDHTGPCLVLLKKCTASRQDFINLIETTFLRRYITRVYWCGRVAETKEDMAAQVRENLAHVMQAAFSGNAEVSPHGALACFQLSQGSQAEQEADLHQSAVASNVNDLSSLNLTEGNVSDSEVDSSSSSSSINIATLEEHTPLECLAGSVESSASLTKAEGLSMRANNSVTTIRSTIERQLRLRLQTYPRDLSEWLIDELPGVNFQPKGFTHALHVVDTGGKVYFAISPGEDMWLLPCDRAGTTDGYASRAVSKLEEIFTVTGLRLHESMTAMDVGAAPGAWTEYMSEHAGHVVAIDPAVLSPDALRSNVTHFQKKVEDVVYDLEAWPQGLQASVLVCDMNKHPVQAARMLKPLLPFVAPGGLIIMTMKFHGKGRSKVNQLQEVILALTNIVEGAAFIWLMANSIYERTFVAVKS
eukprot:jgi/Mesen1/5314/ME000265S04471